MEPYKITHPGQPYEGPHIGRLLANKLDTHRWHVLRHLFDNDAHAGRRRASQTHSSDTSLISAARCTAERKMRRKYSFQLGADDVLSTAKESVAFSCSRFRLNKS
jgi:hypothetical protein